MPDISAKAVHLMAYVDLRRPDMTAVKASCDRARAFVEHLARPPRPHHRFEHERKQEILAFLREHYAAWRDFDASAAQRIAAFSIKQAQGARALADVSALGRAWWATGDPAWGAAFERFYLSVPTGGMFSWGSFNGTQGAVELDAYFLLLDCPAFTVAGRIAFLDHLHAISDDAWDDHTSRWRQIHLGPEGHNWYLHGVHVLPLVGLLFPEFKRSSFFLRTGWSVVEEHVRGHYKADGGARETTLGYQAGSMLNLWDVYAVATRNNHRISDGFADRLLNATKFLLRLMTPQGGLPSFGDGGHSPGALTALAATAAALTGDGECKWYAERCRKHSGAIGETPGILPYCAFWNVGLAGAETYRRTRPRDPHHVSVLMGHTGYAALRNSNASDANYMAIAAADRGPIVTSHGHNDVFSLDICAAGTRFIGEMGCAPYGISPARAYDKKTEAHTCLTLAGWEQAPIISEWRWGALVIPAIRRWISTETHDFFHGVHEGFYRYPEHMTLHARKVLFIKPEPSYWIVFDWVESAVFNTCCAYFHGCVPGVLRGKVIILGRRGKPRLAVIPPKGDTLSAGRVTSAGLRTYIKAKNLDAESYPCFVYRKRVKCECFVWLIAPLLKGERTPTVRRMFVRLDGATVGPYEATALSIAHEGCRDLVCLSHKDFDAHLEFGGQTAWGFLAFRRTHAAGRRALTFTHEMADGTCGR
jgi:hypothetical protein